MMFNRFDAALIGGLAAAMVLTALCGFGGRCAQVRDETLRLHILAASDSAEDQEAKLAVRDAVLAQYGAQFGKCTSQAGAISLAEKLLGQIEQTATETLAACGENVSVRAQLVTMYFDTREYENGVILPAGDYPAVRLLLGAGAGRNWWCVMFPPLCVGAAADCDAARDIGALAAEPEYELRFAAVELAEKLRGLWNPPAEYGILTS